MSPYRLSEWKMAVRPEKAQEMPSESAGVRRAEAMARDSSNAGALAFKRSGDPGMRLARNVIDGATVNRARMRHERQTGLPDWRGQGAEERTPGRIRPFRGQAY